MKDYSFLKGSEVDYIIDDIKVKIFVAEIDRNTGITCKGNFDDEADDAPLQNFICLNEDDHNKGYYAKHCGNMSWDDLFNSIAEQLASGTYVFKRRHVINNELSNCAFE